MKFEKISLSKFTDFKNSQLVNPEVISGGKGYPTQIDCGADCIDDTCTENGTENDVYLGSCRD